MTKAYKKFLRNAKFVAGVAKVATTVAVIAETTLEIFATTTLELGDEEVAEALEGVREHEVILRNAMVVTAKVVDRKAIKDQLMVLREKGLLAYRLHMIRSM